MFLAALPSHPDIMQALGFILTGLFMVMLVLASLNLFITSAGFFFKRIDQRAAASAAAAAAAAHVHAAETAPAEDPNLVAVISAAVHATLDGQEFRIMSVEPSGGSWAREGLRQTFSSHRLR
jgi:Na+-transporting methylmalonyl-CoA/oxaloacetate decarboxylase gamma subunit